MKVFTLFVVASRPFPIPLMARMLTGQTRKSLRMRMGYISSIGFLSRYPVATSSVNPLIAGVKGIVLQGER